MTRHTSKMKTKTGVSLFLSIVMILSGVSIPATEAYGASDDSPTATKGVYYFEPHEVPDVDLTDTYVYDDSLLKGDSLAYNKALATMSYELAVASMSSQRVDYPEKSQNLRAFLEDNGFVDFEANQYYKEKMTTTSMGAACAHKTIVDGGKEYTLLVIAPRSAGYESEWGGNFVMSDSASDTKDHAGFKNGKDIVLGFAKEYVEKYGITGDIKVWTAGYSRGAGVTNQVGAGLANRPQYYLGESINLDPANLYCYTFGTPNSASVAGSGGAGTEGLPGDDKFKYIHNTLEPYDIVTIAPPSGFGFNRYGTVTGYASSEKKDRMLEMLKQTNSVVYDLYTNGGDPDGFAPKTIRYSLIDGSSNLEIIDCDETSSYLPANQKDFMSMMSESIAKAMEMDTVAGSDSDSAREKYYKGKYQDAMHDLCGYLFANLDKAGDIVDGIQNSKYVKPMAASMYVSYMLEMYRNEIAQNSSDQLEVLRESLAALVEAAGGSEGVLPEDAPAEIKQAYAELVAEINNTEQTAANWDNIAKLSRGLTTALFKHVFKEGLVSAGVPESASIYKIATDPVDSDGNCEGRALSRILSYMMLFDTGHTNDTVISFEEITDQVMHMATFMGNASSFMRPHNNEVILSWLRANDSNYDDYAKENTAQKSGYRRLYIEQPAGVSVTATVKDGSGKTVAVVKDGKLISRTDSWIGVTTCDTGNWLRLPCDKTYKVDLKTSKDTKLNLKATEYSVYDGKEVRTVTNDKKYNWKGLAVKTNETTTWVISAIPGSKYSIASSAYYYIEKVAAGRDVLVAKGIAKGKRKAKISWNKISGAQRYVIYMSKCNTPKKKYTPKKVKTVSASTQTWTRKTLRKNKKYKFYVVAQKKVNGKYVDIAKSRMGHVITNNKSGKYTNPKTFKLNVTQMTLGAGKTAGITGKVSKVKKKKKLMYSHEALLRYTSTNPSVAKVSSDGTVTAVAAGSCRIYVQTINGMWKTVSVTVK